MTELDPKQFGSTFGSLVFAEHPVGARYALAAARATRTTSNLLTGSFANRTRPATNQSSHVSCTLRARLDCSI